MSNNREPPDELIRFLEPYGQPISMLFLDVRRFLLQHCPEANELIYDAFNAVSCAYSFSEKLADAFCHIASYSAHVNLGFNQGTELSDPSELLSGNGKSIRHITIRAAEDLSTPGYEELVLSAIKQGAKAADPRRSNGVSFVKSISKQKRRPV